MAGVIKKITKKRSKAAAKANATKAAKKSAAEKAADAIKSKGRVSTAQVANFIKEHGEKAAAKNFSKMQVSRAKKRVSVDKVKEKNPDLGKTVKTPTSRKRPRKVVKEQSKASIKRETEEGMRKRPQGAMTTVIGATPGRPRATADRKKLREARREMERRKPSAEFESELNQLARQTGVENLGQRGRALNEGPKDTGFTREQVGDEMRDQTLSRKEAEQKRLEDMATKLIKENESSKKKKGGKVAKRAGGGAIRGMGKAIRGGRKPKFR